MFSNDFHQVLRDLHVVLWAENCAVLNQPNVATHAAFLKVLVEAQDTYLQEGEEASSFAPTIEKQAVQSGTQKRKENSEDVDKGANLRRKKHMLGATLNVSRNIQGQSHPGNVGLSGCRSSGRLASASVSIATKK